MATSRKEIEQWFDEGQDDGDLYMLIICDTYDWSDYPVYCATKEDAERRIANPGEMQKVMEVYNLVNDKYIQLDQPRAWSI